MANFSPGPGNPEATRESQEQQGKTLESKGTIPNIERVTQALIEIHGGLQRFLTNLENYPDFKKEIENILKKIIEIRGRLYPEKDFTSPEELKILTEELPQLILRLREILNNLKRLNLKEYIIIAPETYVNLIEVLINKIEENLVELEKNIPRRGGWTRRKFLIGIGAILTALLGYLGFREYTSRTSPLTETPTPTIPPTATPTATATATPEPTATATQEPTATATPEPTPTPDIFEIIEEESANFINRLKETLLKSSRSYENKEPFYAKVLDLLANDPEFLKIMKEFYERLRFSGFEFKEMWEPHHLPESFVVFLISFINPYPLKLEINKKTLDERLNKLRPNQTRLSKVEFNGLYYLFSIGYPSLFQWEVKLSSSLGCYKCDVESDGRLTYNLKETGGDFYFVVVVERNAQKSLQPKEIAKLIKEITQIIVESLPEPPKRELKDDKTK